MLKRFQLCNWKKLMNVEWQTSCFWVLFFWKVRRLPEIQIQFCRAIIIEPQGWMGHLKGLNISIHIIIYDNSYMIIFIFIYQAHHYLQTYLLPSVLMMRYRKFSFLFFWACYPQWLDWLAILGINTTDANLVLNFALY